MNVLGVVGGPRRAGNTVKLVETILEGAREAGHETVLFKLAELDIGHLGDVNGEVAFPEDDFDRIKPHLESMGTLVLGSPIYYGQFDSRMMTFINRLYYYSSYYSEENRRRFPKGVKAVNVITYGQDDPNYYDDVLVWVKDMEKGYGMKGIRSLVAEGTGDKPVESRPNLLNKASEIGRRL